MQSSARQRCGLAVAVLALVAGLAWPAATPAQEPDDTASPPKESATSTPTEPGAAPQSPAPSETRPPKQSSESFTPSEEVAPENDVPFPIDI